MILVGGVPGAGKSTAILRHVGTPGVRVLDPDRLRGRLPWRALVHLVHQALVWGAVLLGPRVSGVLLVQDTATRRRRREALLRLALWRGWDVHLVLVDVSRAEAVTGQVERGRPAPAGAFERHWGRWEGLRRNLDQVGVPPLVVGRADVAAVVDALVPRPPRLCAGQPDPVRGRDRATPTSPATTSTGTSSIALRTETIEPSAPSRNGAPPIARPRTSEVRDIARSG